MVYISVLRDSALLNYALAGLLSGLSSMVQYQVSKEHSLSCSGWLSFQWSQGDLTEQPGTVVSSSQTETGVSPTVTGTGVSPNDGYGINGQGFVSQYYYTRVVVTELTRWSSDKRVFRGWSRKHHKQLGRIVENLDVENTYPNIWQFSLAFILLNRTPLSPAFELCTT